MSAHPAFRIQGPALISFSGGRTSAFMLHEILRAHGGKLPDDVVVAFANTGKEREETLRFVHECGSRWGVRIHWLQWQPGKAGFDEVGFNSAARDGEPFAELMRRKQYLPNATMRYCTSELKIRPIKHFMLSRGVSHWTSVIGLRYDEGHRVLKQLAFNEAGKERWQTAMPMSKARHIRADVLRFWLGPTMRIDEGVRPQGFDLGLRDYEGNCDLCFLKSRDKLAAIIAEKPRSADWWIQAEQSAKTKHSSGAAKFRRSESYQQLASFVRDQGLLPFSDDDEDHDVECGLTCGDQDDSSTSKGSVP
jgi:3'-phosphoadenosine 5'-phosphosulfate sulfotransferase (PAPS reductase)/FAD synthetase